MWDYHSYTVNATVMTGLQRAPRDAPPWSRTFLMESELLEKALEASAHASSMQQGVACGNNALLEKALEASVPKSSPAKITSISFSDGSQFVRTGEVNPFQMSPTESAPKRKTGLTKRIPCLKSQVPRSCRRTSSNGETPLIDS